MTAIVVERNQLIGVFWVGAAPLLPVAFLYKHMDIVKQLHINCFLSSFHHQSLSKKACITHVLALLSGWSKSFVLYIKVIILEPCNYNSLMLLKFMVWEGRRQYPAWHFLFQKRKIYICMLTHQLR